MKNEFDEQLRKKYPNLYCYPGNNKIKTISFGCGDGWYPLLDVISELLMANNENTRAVQVKEKFGQLRFYHSGSDDYSLGVEMGALLLSSIICEDCGAAAKRRSKDGLIVTLCDNHHDGFDANRDDPKDLSGVEHLGFGRFWAEMVVILLDLCKWNSEQRNKPEAVLQISKSDDKLVIDIVVGDDFTKGMVDLFVGYANRVDEQTGLPHQNIGHSNDDL